MALCALLLSNVGCQNLRPSQSPGLITPLGSSRLHYSAEQTTPDTERELCIQTAETVAARGHFSEAIALYEQAEKLDPNQPPLHRQLAPLYAQAGQADQAIQRYQSAIADSPNDADLVNNFAWTLIESNRPRQAILVIDNSLLRFPNHQRLKSSRAIATYHVGDRDAAIERFISLYGPAAGYHNVALLDVESGEHANAQQAVQLALTHGPSSETIQLATAIEQTMVVQ